MPGVRAARVAALAGLLALVTLAWLVVATPGSGVAFYALVPIVLSGFWFGWHGAMLTAVTAAVVYLVTELIDGPPALEGVQLWAAIANRSVIFLGVAGIISWLREHEHRLSTRVGEQQQQLSVLEPLRAALTPAQIPARPGLELATAFLPADGVLAGDFFLVAPGPGHTTTLVVGDVVGHGLEAARQATYVRASLATFTAFTSDPAWLLQLANTALLEQGLAQAKFMTLLCVTITADRQLRWARAGHHPPWRLDTAEPLCGGRPGTPLGLSPALDLKPGCTLLPAGSGLLLFTDGLPEARPAHRDHSRPLELFGEHRLREVLTAHHGASPNQVVDALSAAVRDFAGGALADDVCIIACRATLP